LLARDLNEAMDQPGAPERIVLFFDTHEAFWGEARSLPNETYFLRDEWLRKLLLNLHLAKGIVAVVAGREPPRWAEAGRVKPRIAIPQQYLCTKRVGNLTREHALAYLQQEAVGITDPALCDSLIAYASEAPDEVHPFHLGFCADVVLEAQAKGCPLTAADFATVPDFAERSQQLVERLLRYVSQDVRAALSALSACRAFDFELYKRLGEALGFAPYQANFDLITGFSFVRKAVDIGLNGYRLHGLLRRLNYEAGQEKLLAAHQFLEQYYRTEEHSDPVEVIYHANRLDENGGIQEWVEVFENAFKLARYQDCERLIAVRSELRVAGDLELGQLSQAEGDYYYRRLAKYDEAAREYSEAIAAYDSALTRAPDDINALNNKGNALQRRGELQAQLAQHTDALSSYSQAIAAYDSALTRAPDDIRVLNNKGNALQSRGDLQARLAQHTDALSSYSQAIAAYDSALTRAPDDTTALNNKGLALKNRGDLQARLAQHQEALDAYTQAIAAYDSALTRAPDYINALNNKGTALQSRGDLQAQLAQHNDALTSYTQAIAAYDSALTRAPDYIYALNNKGVALQRRGDLQAQLAQHNDALSSYSQAIAAYDSALTRAPDYIDALNNKGDALYKRYQVQVAGAGENEEAEAGALANLQAAVAHYSRSLEIAPNQAEVRQFRDSLQGLLDNEDQPNSDD
jgi:tetratricopeptide (TPR) repeat protein